jgi:sulfite reductase (NADPH) flavoprotein alpha-component
VLVAFASQTGTAEQLAWQTAQSLRAGGMVVRVLPLDS